MALAKEVLDMIAYAEGKGYSTLNRVPPAETRERIGKNPPHPDPTPVRQVKDLLIPGSTSHGTSKFGTSKFGVNTPGTNTPGAKTNGANTNGPNTNGPNMPTENTTTTNPDIPVRIYIPNGEGPFPVVSYFHGGGFVFMSIQTHDEICRKLCARSGCLIMSVEYRLAPEHPYPQGPEDCLTATSWLIQNAAQFNGRGDKAAVAGDSAGGYMALYVAQKLAARGIRLQAQFAAYPVTDHYSAGHASWTENATGYVLTAELMQWLWDNYLPDSGQIEEASILRAPDLGNLPPTLIITANYDPLRDEGKAYADKLRQSGVETIYQNYGHIHNFLGLGPIGETAMDAAANFLKEKLTPPG